MRPSVHPLVKQDDPKSTPTADFSKKFVVEAESRRHNLTREIGMVFTLIGGILSIDAGQPYADVN